MTGEREDESVGDSISIKVYEYLVSQLLSAETLPGERLSIDSLARRYNVSQTPVRAALIRLEAEGLVVRKHNIGFSVAPLADERQLKEIFVLRRLIEPEAARLAATHARNSQIAALYAICRKMSNIAANKPERQGESALLDQDFHMAIADATGNNLIGKTLDTLHSHIQLCRLRYHNSVAEDTVQEHIAIVEAIEKHDQEEADKSMVAHICNAYQRMLAARPKPP